jgi:hypothetical protein
MTSHVGRLYALALSLVAFFLAWAVVAARPWGATAADPRLQALAARESQLRQEATLVQAAVGRRRAAYRAQLQARKAQIAAAAGAAAPAQGASSTPAPASSPVKVVNLPPLTITRTS